jgi:lipopolysaccharide/colanic/teichoic acid biosynthesis glycosyltransferase
MDVLFQPQTVTPRRQLIASRFRSYSYPSRETCQYSGFCYIGKNSSHIDKLVNLYGGGYAFDDPEFVMAEMQKMLWREPVVFPEVIICEGRFEVSVIRRFTEFLRNHRSFSCIPFILDASGLSEAELTKVRRNTRPDEMLDFAGMNEQQFRSKVGFLKRLKSEQERMPRIEEPFAGHGFRVGLAFKRGFDILVASVALVLLSPLFLLIALAIKLESKGPIFYIAKRAGRGYRIFNFYKFRTMIQDADKKMPHLTHLNQYTVDSAGPVFFKMSNDPRVTKVGSFLRNTSLDELPQLVNVILGHMSVVGNRPLPLYEAAALTTDDYAARFMAPAGITGLWQVKKRGNKDMSTEERISMDIDYAANCSFATDLWIIANTPSALFQRENV